MTIIVLIFGEITPKTIAKEFPEQFAMFSMHLIKPMIIIFKPFNYFFGLITKGISKLFVSKENNGITEEEIFTIVEEAAEAGNIDDEEKDLIQNAIEFNDLFVGDIYTPRVDVVAIPKTIEKEEINKIFKETSYSRLPVYDENIDNIIGILNYKDFINKEYKLIEEILQPTIFVIKTNKIKEVLKNLQKNKTHLAIVINEYCEMIGIITLEDIVEEIVGEIWDEHDEINVEIENIKENEYIISGYAELYILEDLFGLDIKTETNTISGWIMETIGRLPQINDTFEYKNIKVEVLSIQNKRTNKVKIINIMV
jgi:CBS domain containing-hemolysin-like protein